MRLIPKKQQGGSMFSSYFTKYTPVGPAAAPQAQQGRQQQAAPAQSSSGDSERGKITEQDLFKALDKIDGLPNETQMLVNQLKTMYAASSLSGNPQSLATMYANILGDIKIAQFNKKAYDNAFNEVTKNEGMNEFAITASGHLVVQTEDEDGIQLITVEQYLKNPGKYNALTNSNILNMRAFDPQFAQNNQVLEVVSNGIGINKVVEMIKSRMSNLGETNQTIEGYTAKQSKDIHGGIQILEEAAAQTLASGMTVDGLYKTHVITKDQKVQAEAALKYIYQTLPNNAKAILQLHSNNAKDPVAGALDIIGNMILSQEDFTAEYRLDYQAELNADGTKRKSSSSGDGDDDGDEDAKDVYNTASLLIMGKGQQQMQIINPGTDLAFSVLTSSLPLVDAEGKPLGKNHTLTTLTQSQYSGVLDFDKATMGGSKIKDTYYGSVIINSDKISVLDFPTDENGNPDLRPTTIDKKKRADQMMKQAGIDINNEASVAQNADKINNILQQVGLNAAYDSQGRIISGNWKRFAVLNATADNRALSMGDLDDNSQLLEVTDDNHIDQLIGIIKSENKLDKYEFDKDNWYDWNGHDSFYQGTLWIPVIENYFSAQSGSGQKMKMQQIKNINNWETEQYVQQNYRKPPGL